MAGAIAGALLTVAAVTGVRAFDDWRLGRDAVVAAVDAHVRASLTHGAVQVASSDHHTVKPWLSARLDYSPPVDDDAADGFALAGARIEALDGRRVATLVYRYRDHTIDVFVAPQAAALAGARTTTLRGFNAVRANGQAMAWLIVSDVNAEGLGAFAERLAAGRARGSPRD